MAQIDKTLIENMLHHVQKPARYTGGELNSVVKQNPRMRVAICYPDLYEIGMSNSGMRILYDRANGIDGVSCERVFAVAEDYEKMLREMNIPLYTLETFTPLNEMDIVGFNISHELLYTNVLQVLDLGRIPIFAKDRNNNDPLVIAGGESVSNPWPVCDFIDAFFIGDGEEGIVDVINALMNARSLNISRKEILDTLGGIDGILIPANYSFQFRDERLIAISGKKVKRRVNRASEPNDPAKPVVPNIRITQDRAVVELTRGCYNLCKFCHACYFNLPYRHYGIESIKNRVLSLLKNTGYSEVTLSSLSVSDYRHLVDLINTLLPELTSDGVSISLPSLRVDLRTLPLIEEISDLRKTSLTFAVESASEEMRRISAKSLSNDDLLRIVEAVFRRGWRVIKLYFMIGLPGCETVDEAAAIIDLLKKIALMARGKKEINVTLSPFVPKPHTPFQREKMMDEDYFKEAVRKIKSSLPRMVKIKSHNLSASVLEGVFSRGDARLCSAVHAAFTAGCRFDSWEEHLKADIWQREFGRLLPHWRSFLGARNEDDILPWSCVETGGEDLIARMKGPGSRADVRDQALTEEKFDLESLSRARKNFTEKYLVKKRARLRFTKTGLAKFIPHIDFIEILKRALRMAKAPVSFTQGFNKRERISTGYALPVGIESDSELCDLDLYESIAPEFFDRISSSLPEGISFREWNYIDDRDSLTELIAAVEYEVEVHSENLYHALMEGIRVRPDIEKKSKHSEKSIPYDEIILGNKVSGAGSVRLLMSSKGGGPARIDDVVLRLSGVDRKCMHLFRIIKTGQYSSSNGRLELI